MLDAGMNVMRLNFSHGDYANTVSAFRISAQRDEAKLVKPPLSCLIPKVRKSRAKELEGGNDVSLKAGQTFTFTTDKSVISNSEMVAVTYEGISLLTCLLAARVLVDDSLIGKVYRH